MKIGKTIHSIVVLCAFACFSLSSHAANNNTGVSNDPTGKLFIKQATGDTNNCGPIVALVARKFSTQDFQVQNLNKSIIAARTLITPSSNQVDDNDELDIEPSPFDSRWWNISDIQRYLIQHKVPSSQFRIKQGSNTLLKALDNGNILIINVNMNDLPMGSGLNAIGKPYLTFPIPGGWGHFMVITGYQYVDKKLVFQIHDSISKRGKNRLYYATNIVNAIKRYSPEVIVVNKDKSTTLVAQ